MPILDSINQYEASPVAVGGLGGSGTRLAASMLQSMGFFIGDHLNISKDNLWFTLLLKRHQWIDSFPHDSEIYYALELFNQINLYGFHSVSNEKDIEHVQNICCQYNANSTSTDIDRETAWLMLNDNSPGMHGHSRWAWKEPNTHVFIPQLSHHFSKLKYVHVIRNGFHMAISSNQNQVRNWGRFFGLNVSRDKRILPSDSLDFWIAANRRAVRLGRKLLGTNFLLLNYDKLCGEFKIQELNNLIEFLGLSPTSDELSKLIQMPVMPASHSQQANQELSCFSNQQIEDVEKLGYRATNMQY